MKIISRMLCVLLVLALSLGFIPNAVRSAQAASAYYIVVDITNQYVTVYRNGNVSNSGIVRQMICSTGKSGTSTPTGTFTLPSKSRSSERTEWYYFSKYGTYAKYATRIKGGILFHSVLFNRKGSSTPTSSSVKALGSKASHGCIRLRVEDAKWIAQNCPAGTKVKIYKSGKTNSTVRSKLKKASYNGSVAYSAWLGSSSSAPAPVKTFGVGSSGTQIASLQQALTDLKLYTGEIDGQYGNATATAVSNYQSGNGQSVTGTVTEAQLTSIVNKAAQIKAQFPDTDYMLVTNTVKKQMAKVKVNSRLNLRKSASTSASVLTRLSNKTQVSVISRGSKWSKIQYGKYVGYALNTYLSFFTTNISTISYQAVVPPAVETPEEVTSESAQSGPEDPDPAAAAAAQEAEEAAARDRALKLQQALKALKFYTGEENGQMDEATLTALQTYQRTFGETVTSSVSDEQLTKIAAKANDIKSQFPDSDYELSTWTDTQQFAKVSVNTKLNLRQSASTSSTVLAKLNNNTVVSVLAKGAAWSKVQAGNKVGYCNNTYLSFYTVSTSQPVYSAVERQQDAEQPESELTVAETENAPAAAVSSDDTDVSVENTVLSGSQTESEAAPAETTVTEEHPSEDTSSNVQAPLPKYAVVASESANIYTEASTSSSYTAAVKGACFTVVSTDEDWTVILVDNKELFVQTRDLILTNTLPSSVPAAESETVTAEEPSEQPANNAEHEEKQEIGPNDTENIQTEQQVPDENANEEVPSSSAEPEVTTEEKKTEEKAVEEDRPSEEAEKNDTETENIPAASSQSADPLPAPAEEPKDGEDE